MNFSNSYVFHLFCQKKTAHSLIISNINCDISFFILAFKWPNGWCVHFCYEYNREFCCCSFLLHWNCAMHNTNWSNGDVEARCVEFHSNERGCVCAERKRAIEKMLQRNKKKRVNFTKRTCNMKGKHYAGTSIAWTYNRSV